MNYLSKSILAKQNKYRIRAVQQRSQLKRLLLVLFIGITSTLQAHSVFAFNRHVDSTGGVDAGNCLNPASPCQTIAFAITTAVPGDEIVLMSLTGAPNVYNESGLLIPFNLTVRGVSAIQSVIDGGGIDRIFTVNGGNLTLARVTLQNGNANPIAGGTGGAVQLINGNLRVHRSVVKNNVALLGGAIAAANTAGTVRISSSRLSANRSTASGGAVHCDACTGIAIRASTIIKNTAGAQGGGVFVQSSSLAAKGTRFTKNNADDGGAIFSSSSQVVIHDSELRDNEADQGDGGGVFSAGNLSIQRSLLAGNSATDNGGGVFLFGPVMLASSNSTYSGNRAIAGGGLSVVANIGAIPTVHVSNSTFVDNVSTFVGQGHHITGVLGSVRLDNSIFHLSPGLLASNPVCNVPVFTGAANLISDVSCNPGGAAFNFGAVSGFNATLAFNGGFTRTHRINAASNAVDNGFPGLCINSQTGNPLTVDQRRMSRPVGICDIGAFELQ